MIREHEMHIDNFGFVVFVQNIAYHLNTLGIATIDLHSFDQTNISVLSVLQKMNIVRIISY